MTGLRCFFSILFFATAMSASAAEYRIEARPGALQAFIDSGKLASGDRVVLGPGRHGALTINGRTFSRPVTLVAAEGARPVLDRLQMRGASGWRFEGLAVTPAALGGKGRFLVDIQTSDRVAFDGVSVATADSTSRWSAGKWRENVRSGMFLAGRDITVRNSEIRNVRHGIVARSDGARIEGNVIENFSGDGIRALGDNSIYRGNAIRTCVGTGDGNHDDGIQSWSEDAKGRPGRGVVRNVRIENNVIQNGRHRLACKLQGIGLFDGIYADWTIRGNVVIVDHWHGITVMGGTRVRIEDNIVVDANKARPGPPWITITAHKNGTKSKNSVISGNVTQPWSGGGNRKFKQPQPGVRSSGNRVVETAEAGLRLRR